MELQPKNQNSLHKRVNEYLRGTSMLYLVEENEDASLAAIFDQLHEAQEELEVIQARVDRLQWELAKDRS